MTDLSILNKMLPAPFGAAESLEEFIELRCGEAGIVEGAVEYPQESTLGVVTQALQHFYSFLLTDDLGRVKGIITRADLLKLTNKNSNMKTS